MNRGVFFIVAAAVLWGCFPTIGRFLYSHGSDPVAASTMRALTAAAIYAVIGVKNGDFKGIKGKDIPFFLCYGLTAVTGMYYFYHRAIDMVSIAMAAVLLYTAPAFVIIFSRIIYGEKITASKLVSLVLTFGGAVLVCGVSGVGSNMNPLGIAFGLAAGLCYSTLTIFGRYGLERYSQRANTFLPTIFGALVLCVIRPVWTIPMGSVELVAGYVAIAVVGSVLPCFFYIKGLGMGVEGGRASVIATIELVVASLVGVIVAGDNIYPMQIVGIALVILGAAIQVTGSGPSRGALLKSDGR